MLSPDCIFSRRTAPTMSHPRRFVFGPALRRRRSLRLEHLEARLALAAEISQLLSTPAPDAAPTNLALPNAHDLSALIDNLPKPAEVKRAIVPGVIVVAFE